MSAKATILIVDDNPTNLSVLFESLQKENYRVIVAQDGESALDRLNYAKPDIVLLDVMMPGIDGFETLRQIKENPQTAGIPVIFMTALNEATDEIKGLTLGAVDYILKPLRVELVLARIATHLSLHQMQVYLEEQNAELEAYAHTVAHDLKGPLALMLGYTELMYEQGPGIAADQYTHHLRVLWESVQKQIRIIDELLLFSSIRKEDVQLSPVNMAVVIYNVQARLNQQLNDAQATLFIPETWPVALGHEDWLEEVWSNYISNAIKYGGSPPEVTLGSSFQADGTVKFWVKDNGQGIPPAAQARLFQEHSRLRRHKVSGHGLGLSIVKRIIEKLGGSVGVESQPDAGSLFYFTLPANT